MTQTSSRFQFPDEQILVIRPSFNTICCGVRPAAKVLSYLCYQYNNSKNPVLDEKGGFTVRRTQDELVEATCKEFDKKTLHDTAIPWLMLIGFIDLIEQQGTAPNEYIVYPAKVQEALNLCNKPQALHDWLKNNSRLELFLIEKLPLRLELSLIVDKKFFQSTLEKVLIQFRTFSNHKRGRKARTEAMPEGVSEAPKIVRDKKDNKKDSKRAAANASLPSVQTDTSAPNVVVEKENKKAASTRRQTEKKPAPPELELTPEEQAFDSLYRQMWYIAKAPKVTETYKKNCGILCKYVKTKADLDSLDKEARKTIKDKVVHPGNLVNALNSWLQTRADTSKLNTDQGEKSKSYQDMTKPELIEYLVSLPTRMDNKDPLYRVLTDGMMYLSIEEKRDVITRRKELERQRRNQQQELLPAAS